MGYRKTQSGKESKHPRESCFIRDFILEFSFFLSEQPHHRLPQLKRDFCFVTSQGLPGESRGQGSLVGCSPWGHTELDTTEVTQQQQQQGLSRILKTQLCRKWSPMSYSVPEASALNIDFEPGAPQERNFCQAGLQFSLVQFSGSVVSYNYNEGQVGKCEIAASYKMPLLILVTLLSLKKPNSLLIESFTIIIQILLQLLISFLIARHSFEE